MHYPPLTIALFENCRAQAAAIDVPLLSVLRYIGRDRVLKSGPGSLASEVNLEIAEFEIGRASCRERVYSSV